jgi:hypothetical protein
MNFFVFSPSSSKSEKLPAEYEKAEVYGAIGKCGKYVKLCPISILDLVTTISYY